MTRSKMSLSWSVLKFTKAFVTSGSNSSSGLVSGHGIEVTQTSGLLENPMLCAVERYTIRSGLTAASINDCAVFHDMLEIIPVCFWSKDDR